MKNNEVKSSKRANKKDGTKKMSKKKKIIIGTVSVVLILIFGSLIFLYNYMNNMKSVQLQGSNEELKVSEEISVKSK
ncbi:MAG: hypothetical protein ACRC2K_09675, partial [Clostridium sp.]